MDNTKELISAIEKVRSYCHNQDNCLHCIFYDVDLDCCNIQGVPDEWVYNRFSQDDVQMSKIFKRYGVSGITKKHGVTYYLVNNDFQAGLPKGLFENVLDGEIVSLDEIIGNADL